MNASSRSARCALLLGGVLLALLLCGAASVARAEALSFAPKVDYVTGMNPYNTAVADINGDGVKDLAAATDDGTVSVLLGYGDGTFAAGTDFGVGAIPTVAVGDLNGDGKQDLATVNWTSPGTVSVLLGNGDGTFQPKADFATGPYPVELVAADFNGDGRADLAMATGGLPSASTVSVLLGNGDGTFQAKKDVIGNFYEIFSVAVGDFNGDGKADLVTANYGTNTCSVLLGNGDGTFQVKAGVLTGSGPMEVAVGDFNGDGRADLTTANDNDSVSVLLGNGNGTFAAKADFAAGSGPFFVAVGDFNSDGKADLVTANERASTVSVLLGYGNGGFAAKKDLATGSGPTSVAVGDFNSDGKADLVTSNYATNTVSVLLNTTSTEPAPPTVTIASSATLVEGGTLARSGSFDDLDSTSWTATVDYGDGPGVQSLLLTGQSFALRHTYLDDGVYTVRVTVTDDGGLAGSASMRVTVFGAAPKPGAVTVAVNPVAKGTQISASVPFSDAGVLDTHSAIWDWGDGTTSPGTVSETGGTGTASGSHAYTKSGVYAVTVTLSDDDGMSAHASTMVTVVNAPPKLGVVTVPFDPVAVNTQISAGVPFSDADVLDTHAAVWDWGDGTTSPGTVSEAGGTGMASGSHAYAMSGVYAVTVTLSDDDGMSASAVSEQYVVVYDPGAGFVTGGGRIDSPAGAYKAAPTVVAKASFGFVSKYFKKATYPRGSTRFILHGCFDFNATTYDSLVVAGAIAQYKGSGTVNGTQGYSFLLSALDGQAKGGGGVDMFRIKIWNAKTGTVVYDTQSGAVDSAPPTTPLAGGSIVIHS